MERQLACVASWQRYGNDVVAVQTSIEPIRPIDGVEYRIVPPSDTAFDRSYLPLITDLIGDGGGLLLNSDIELLGPIDFDFRPGALYCGIRHNESELEGFGIDAFYVPPGIACKIPDVGLLVGMPGWDWWLPYHCHLAGIPIDVDKRPIYHHTPHPVCWSSIDHATSKRIIREQCGIKHEALKRFILELTGRL
ncbi:hypothetical protein [Rosistilla oblonga]|uniref:hypothetical protein n=1 Tax=Rosistilla oblonga TaxID=2527990 RepID=UPI003A981382